MGEINSQPLIYARIAGALYLIIIAAGVFPEAIIRSRLVVPEDPSLTARYITENEFLFRVGIVCDLSTFILAVVLTTILYLLLKPVNKNLALLMLIFNLVQDAIGGINVLNTHDALRILGSSQYLSAFSAEQLNAMALLSLDRHSTGFGVALIFFGLSCVVLGYLIFKSGFIPRFLGVLLGIVGICYLLNSLAFILSPAISSYLFPAILLPAFVGELTLALWLTLKGLDVAKWKAYFVESAST